jgi:hypothetical protein
VYFSFSKDVLVKDGLGNLPQGWWRLLLCHGPWCCNNVLSLWECFAVLTCGFH